MSQMNFFIAKYAQDICSCVQKKQFKLIELAEKIRLQSADQNKYGDGVMSGKEEYITVFVEVMEESFMAKNSSMCCKTIDLIEKLIVYKAIKHVQMTYKGQSVDIIQTLVTLLSAMFRYNGSVTNLYVAKSLTTIVANFSDELSAASICDIFRTLFDMYTITPSSDVCANTLVTYSHSDKQRSIPNVPWPHGGYHCLSYGTEKHIR